VAVVLFEDRTWERLKPLTWLRPVYDLVVGAWTLRERWERELWPERPLLAARPDLSDLLRETHGERVAPAVGAPGDLWINGAWVARAGDRPRELVASLEPGEGWSLGDRPLAFRLATADAAAVNRGLQEKGLLPGIRWREATRSVPLVGHLWDLLDLTESLLREDLEELLRGTPPPRQGVAGQLVVPEKIRLGSGVEVAPGAVVDASTGPVVLGEGCRVTPLTWVQGPLRAGPGCLFLGGRIGGGVVLGPRCKVHGELDSTVVLGFSNKAHDGFVGHSYIGEWVNLGALTTTSDLKNTYGEVRIMECGREVSTGRTKVGSFLGDHVKTAIGTLLATGTVAGVGSHVFGRGDLHPKWIPSFAWGTGGGERYDLERFLAMVERVMARRDRRLTPAMRERLRRVYEATGREEGTLPDRLRGREG
jgi:UDP-N-acetylglucosamine diphosphorylase/glucosamine-1-phosphate N-acetyltransferase